MILIVKMVYFEAAADNHWLLAIGTEYAFSSDYDTAHFEGEINCDYQQMKIGVLKI